MFRLSLQWTAVATVCLLLVQCRDLAAEDKLLRDLIDEDNYNKAVRPPGWPDLGGGCKVDVDVVLISVGPVNNLKMEITCSYYLRQEWMDPRLRFNSSTGVNNTIEISAAYLTKLWLPDMYFPMEKESSRHDITTPNVMVRRKSRVGMTSQHPMSWCDFHLMAPFYTVRELRPPSSVLWTCSISHTTNRSVTTK